MKILVIFTGGTIGSAAKDGFISTDEGTKYALLEGYRGEAEFETVSPYTVLSENLSATELNALQADVAKHIGEGYDGIVVTHGTDTLQYSAAALEYAFAGCDLPVVLVSAAYPLEDERSNGHANFEGAVEFIRRKAGKGVFVSYRNEGSDEVQYHIASHILQHGEGGSDLYSIGGSYGSYRDGKVNVYNRTLSGKGLGVVNYTADSGILVVESHPGNSYGYSLENVRAVMLKPYHSATLDTANEGLAELCRRAREQGITVFVTGVKEGISYESTKGFAALGIIPLPYGTHISAFMKIWAGVSLGKDIAEWMKKDIG